MGTGGNHHGFLHLDFQDRKKRLLCRMDDQPKTGILPLGLWDADSHFFPTCQVRVVRFYQSCRLLLPPPPPPPSPRLLLPPDLNYSHPRQVLAAGPQPRPSQPSVGCRTPTTASPAQCWLPDLNHGHPGAVLAAGPQPPCQI